jgi:hypothetical protein
MGRDVAAIAITKEDRRRYREKVRRCLEALSTMLRDSRFEDDRASIGMEVELNLVDETGRPAMRNAAVLEAIADALMLTPAERQHLVLLGRGESAPPPPAAIVHPCAGTYEAARFSSSTSTWRWMRSAVASSGVRLYERVAVSG